MVSANKQRNNNNNNNNNNMSHKSVGSGCGLVWNTAPDNTYSDGRIPYTFLTKIKVAGIIKTTYFSLHYTLISNIFFKLIFVFYKKWCMYNKQLCTATKKALLIITANEIYLLFHSDPETCKG